MPEKKSKKYYKLNLAELPDDLFDKSVPVSKWLDLATCVEDQFPPNSLNKTPPIDRLVEIERSVGITLYMLGNVLPFAVTMLVVAALLSDIGYLCLKCFMVYFGTLFCLNKYYFLPIFVKKYKRKKYLSDSDYADNQYLYTERNNQKYMNSQFVWPESLHRPLMEEKMDKNQLHQPMIFCAIPHGAAPLGITAYPIWSKLFNNRLCHWTCAPVVLKLPIISTYMKQIGYIPAKARHILDTLTKKEDNIGIILDGIAGMFQSHNEIAHIQARKGIVKIALRAGAPIVPVYGFGHTSLWKVVVDPFGILEKLSVKMDVSLTPFFGRFGWFLGPPQRVAVCMCLGEPVRCPKIAEPTQEDIDKYHQQLLDSYKEVFETHKVAYGWGDKELQFV
ncbi:MAG: hypothetical protein SGBAC_010997 [Bacillariaceae sp.]